MKSSTDVWFCAFLIKNKYDIEKYDVIGRGKLKAYFNMTDTEWQKMKLLFNKSDLSEYKALIDKLKDLCY